MKINGSIALVTGANRGIGRAIVEALCNEGATRIYATARNIDSLADLVTEHQGRIIPVALDITNPEQVDAIAQKAQDVNLLVNNAGVLSATGGFFATNTLEVAYKDMETNYFGTLRMIRAFAPILKVNNGGTIVNLLSVASIVNAPLIATYCASKAALASLTNGVRAQLAQQGTLVIGVFPGPVDTDMAKVVPLNKATTSEVTSAIVQAIEEGIEDVYPDSMSQEVFANISQDLKTLEKQFAVMLP
jgi:NAD(P)-dependent dehydrogenase (short-subunit alcohol dehydrogenase family)